MRRAFLAVVGAALIVTGCATTGGQVTNEERASRVTPTGSNVPRRSKESSPELTTANQDELRRLQETPQLRVAPGQEPR